MRRVKGFMVIIFLLIIMVIAVPPALKSQVEHKKPLVSDGIRIGYTDSYYSMITGLLLEHMLEEEGYTVGMVYSNEPVEDLQNNRISLYTGYITSTDFDEVLYLPHGIQFAGLCSTNMMRGLMVPEYSLIADIGELQEYSGIIYCPSHLERLEQQVQMSIKRYNLSAELVQVKANVLKDMVEEARSNQDFIVVAGYTPSPTDQQRDMRFLGDYKEVFGNSHVISKLTSETFVTEQPIAYGLVENFYLETWEVQELMDWIQRYEAYELRQSIMLFLDYNKEIKVRTLAR